MIRVFIVDDHALVRTGYRLILSGERDMEVVGEAATGEEALPQLRKLKPDVVLCDLHLPGISGLDVTERIARSTLETRVVIVSIQEDGPMPRRLIEAGACGYVGKACDAEELLRAIREVARSGPWGWGRAAAATWPARWRSTWPSPACRGRSHPSTSCRRASWKWRACSAPACAWRRSAAGSA
jgi:DNA-binding NarL/FixJ family response regulator